MEDILSSIKRIIAEDSETTLSGPRVKRSVGLTPLTRVETVEEVGDQEEILELTDPVAVAPAPVAAPTVVAAPKVEPVTTPPAPQAKVEPVAADAKPTLVSSTTAEASRSSLAALSALIVKPETTGSDTLEGLVRDLLKPMLAEWLDAKLPEIVERQVAQEIARISARG
jgi:cell pole-organizing protein PopZ